MVLSIVAAVLGYLFALTVGRRFWRSRQPSLGAWTIGLAIFGAAATTQAIGAAGGFTPALFRAFYLLGGVLGVIYLALGTVFLLAPRRVAWTAAVVLGVLTVLLAVDAAVVPVDAGRLHTTAGILGLALVGHGTPLFVAAVTFNILGTLVLVGGSGWSAWRLIRDRQGVDRVLCNVLLTAGALVVAAGFSAAKLAGGTLTQLGLAESIGIAVMFAGFLSLGRVGQRARRPVAAPGAGRSPTA